MNQRKRVLIIQANDYWLGLLCDIIADYFAVDLESFTTFEEALRAVRSFPVKYDLLITGSLPFNETGTLQSLTYEEFVVEIGNMPVIVVTGKRSVLTVRQAKYNLIEVFEKGSFETDLFIEAVKKVIPETINERRSNYHNRIQRKETRIEYRSDKFSIESVFFGNKYKLPTVKIFLFQLNSFSDDWHEEAGLCYYTSLGQLKAKILGILEEAAVTRADVVIFPELSVPESFLPDIKVWSNANYSVIVVAGSHYHQTGNKIISRCPVFLNGEIFFTEKIYPSPSELSAIGGKGLDTGNTILHFTDSIIGNFFVLICSDNLKIKEIRSECLKLQPDFIIVPAFQKDSNDHYNGMSDVVNNGGDLYYIYSNNKVEGNADGGSAFFGIVRPEIRNELIRDNKTDFQPKGKLCRLAGNEDYFIIDVDVFNKNPPIKKTIGDFPNVRIRTGCYFGI